MKHPDSVPSNAESLRQELERLRAENARLRDSEEFLRISQQIASVGSWDWDFPTGRVRWSDEMFQIFGIRPEDFDGTPEAAAMAFHPDDRGRVEASIRASLEGDETAGAQEYRVLRPDGEERTVFGQGEFVRDEQGEVVRMVGTVLDITEPKRAEQALLQSEQRLRLALSGARMGIWEWDLGERVVWSTEMEAMHGLEPGRFPGTLDVALELIHPEDRAALIEHSRAAIEDPQARGQYDGEHRAVLAGGEVRWILGKGRVVFDASGRPHRMVGVAVDVSERKRLELELRQSQRMESIGRLAGGIAHDFNNLLTAILGSLELAESQGPREGELGESLATIRAAAERAERLTGQLLAFARRQHVSESVLDLNELVVDLHRLLQRLLGEGIELVTLPYEGLDSVRADRGQLEQVLVNLAVNARDAMSDGGKLVIEAQNLQLRDEPSDPEDPGPGDYVVVSVSDDGIGMEEDVRRQVFEPFFSTKDQGSGLGLASSYGIVKQAGGNLTVVSSPGRGSTFRVWLPRADEAVERSVPRGALPTPVGTETVLVAEDEPLLRRLVSRKLREQGFEVLEAVNGEEALDVARRHPGRIHALVTDVIMPRLGGHELVRRMVREDPDLAVLVVSGYSNAPPAEEDHERESSAFLQKPFTPGRLVQELRSVLDRAASVEGV